MTSRNIFPSSVKLMTNAKLDCLEDLQKLEIGESLALEREIGTLSGIRVKLSRVGKRLNKKFRIVDHGDVYEVGRIATIEGEK